MGYVSILCQSLKPSSHSSVIIYIPTGNKPNQYAKFSSEDKAVVIDLVLKEKRDIGKVVLRLGKLGEDYKWGRLDKRTVEGWLHHHDKWKNEDKEIAWFLKDPPKKKPGPPPYIPEPYFSELGGMVRTFLKENAAGVDLQFICGFVLAVLEKELRFQQFQYRMDRPELPFECSTSWMHRAMQAWGLHHRRGRNEAPRRE